MKYTVWVMFNGCARYEIEAKNEDEARTIAIDESDPYDCYEWDFDAEIED